MAYGKGNSGKKWAVDVSQIDCIQNHATLISACSGLVLADLNDEKDKSPSRIHGRYSRIKVNVTDYASKPSVFVSFYLTPSEIRRLHRRAYTSRENTEYKIYWFKRHEKTVVDAAARRVKAESLSIVRCPWGMDFKTKSLRLDANGKPKRMGLPWLITIQTGSCTIDGKNFTAGKTASKKLTDEQFEDFLSNIVRHMEVWEMTFGCQLLRTVETMQEN